MRHGSRAERRYTVKVTAMERGDRWGVRLELTDAQGIVINHAPVADLVFDTPGEASVAGWRFADEWIARLTGGDRDAAAVTEAPRVAVDASRPLRARRAKPGGNRCRLCDRAIEPGQAVSFRRGTIVHLACYEQRISN